MTMKVNKEIILSSKDEFQYLQYMKIIEEFRKDKNNFVMLIDWENKKILEKF